MFANTTGMKRWIVIVAVTLFAIVAVVDIIHDFVTTDPVHYFAEQPRRLLLVAAVAIVCGLIALVFDRLSPQLKHSVKLFTLGSAASCLTVFTGYSLFMLARLSSQVESSDGRRAFILVSLGLGWVVTLLWLEFVQVFKRQDV
jgi:hypothetical protein